MSILVIDVGTSNVRATILRDDGTIGAARSAPTPPARPSPGIVEIDALQIAASAEAVATEVLGAGGPVTSLAIANQRASTVLWERATGLPVAPAIGWQDLRTTGRCLALQASGLHLAPNQSATKLAYLLDLLDADRTRDLCFGTLESWLAFCLSGRSLHVTDATNAAVTGLVRSDASSWDPDVLDLLSIPERVLPRIVDSTGVLGEASALPGAPVIAGLIGDQQAALIGQGCLEEGDAKATFGTGGMLDYCVGTARPSFETKGDAGTFPIVAWRDRAVSTWGIEAIMLSAGSCIDWLRDGLGLIESAAETDLLASSVRDAAGVSFVPALGGIGTPIWDFGARGTLTGMSAGTTKAEVVRAVLEGIAHRGADLLEAAEADGGTAVAELRVDGGMSANATFVQLLADATRRPVVCSSVREATTLGAGFLAGVATGSWSSLAEAATTIERAAPVEPAARLDRDRWLDARSRALGAVPALSMLHF